MTNKFRIKSYEKAAGSAQTLFVVEEIGSHDGEIRISAQNLIYNKNILYGFDKKDLTTIVYAAASELNTQDLLTINQKEDKPI